jgi:uncharacterized cupredoxin-like copper-binding protein
MRNIRLSGIVLAVAIGLVLASCGDPEPVSAPATMDDGGMDDMDGDSHGSFGFGEAADPSDATRTIEIVMDDSFKYDPASIDVAAGETVLFQVTNTGKIVHEFTLGDDILQDEHEQEMQEMGSSMMMADEPNAVSVEPGDTKELAFTFTEPGSLTYACHQPGHFAAGMIADITITA